MLNFKYRYGRLVRSDIPRPRYYNSTRYAFVEFEDPRDAEVCIILIKFIFGHTE